MEDASARLQRAVAVIAAIRRMDFTEYLARHAGSLRLDVGRSDHLAPLLSLIDYEGFKIGRGARKHRTT